MNHKKQYRNDKLQKSSFIFLQLVLILAMLFVYSVLESEYEKKEIVWNNHESDTDEYEIYPTVPDVITIDRPQQIEEPAPKPTPKFDPTTYVLDDKDPDPETLFTPDDLTPDIDVNKLITALPNDTGDTEDHPEPFVNVQSVPRFPGCEQLNNTEAIRCFTKKITRFVNKKFNTGIAPDLGLEGKQQIFVQFVIDKNGEVSDIKSKAAHVALEKEAQRIIEKLPIMTPGMQRDKPVAVKYTLPIRFVIE